MGDRKFRASLSRSKGRKSWCIIYRHPLRVGTDGKPGLRMRRGLGTDDDSRAQELVNQLNVLLGDETYWKTSARDEAARRFDPVIVEAFYEGIEACAEDPWLSRDEVMALPDRNDGYSRVLLVGPTGAGKTTLLRQLIGTDPKEERFPSTSTAKTTVFDTEVVLSPGTFRCVVSFMPRDQARSYVEECVTSAISATIEGANQDTVVRRLLEHSEQRFRLKYLLGALNKTEGAAGEVDDGFDFEDEEEKEEQKGMSMVTEPERTEMASRLLGFVNRILEIASEVKVDVTAQLDCKQEALSAKDQEAFVELVEETIGGSESSQALVEDILSEIESKFDLLGAGSLERDRSDWPRRWRFETSNRQEFVKAVNCFSSNYAPNFGKLLAPIVVGLRVAGPFSPAWYDGGPPSVVFIDGEGLGHTPASAAALPTHMTRRYEQVDVILLVDSATQPMQAASQAVLRSVVASGHDPKLAVVFTHFDHVGGDNLPNTRARREHVIASMENAIQSLDEAIAPNAGRRLRRHLGEKVYFASKLQDRHSDEPRGTQRELARLFDMIEESVKVQEPPVACPVYDMANLVLCVRLAAEQFHDLWNAKLGLSYKSGVSGEHWSRVKALSRRFAYQWADEYDTLRPVADMIKLLTERIAAFITMPRQWEPEDPPQEARDAAVEKVAQKVYSGLHGLITDRLFREHLNEWVVAYGHRGTGSTWTRSRDIQGIYEASTPVPGETPAPDASRFLDDVRNLLREAATAAGGKVIG